jgi:putative membrane protein
MRETGKPTVHRLAILLSVVALVAGLAAAVVLINHYGFKTVSSSLAEVGWSGFLLIVLFHLGVVFLCGIAWFLLVPQEYRPSMWPFVLGRLVRNSSEVVPLSHLGGFIMGARAATVAGVSGSMSFASTVADVTMELLSQFIYVALALIIFARLRPGHSLTSIVTMGLSAASIIAVALTAAQRRGFAVLEAIANRLTLQSVAVAGETAGAVHRCIEIIYGRFSGPLYGFLLHLFGWIAGAAEAWIALRLMGTNPGFAAVLSIEGLLCAARAVAFAVPSALGVQEGAYTILGGFYGINPATVLALSLLKRARDVVLGIPPLIAWQFLESRRIWRRPDEAGDGEGAEHGLAQCSPQFQKNDYESMNKD